MGVINWIPDFQYLHYSHLWTTKEIAYVTKLYGNLVKFSDKIVLSSNNALNDFKGVYPHQLSKAEVVHFVCQPQQDLALLATANRKQVEKYIGADIPYFYLPNQFWKHKNHLTTFRACKILKDKGYVFQLLCSGYMKDFLENSDHIDQLVRYVKENNLDEYIKFLGLIPYSDVFSLTINANALINPSFFEGWSSTVEEAKTVGTLTILSDILVHREQNPINALYFNPEDASQLAQLMEDVLLGNTVVEKPGGAFLQDQLLSRTLEFGKRYMDIVKELTRIKA
jgi:glycosyltransferase involved in cell wall biosynthesis